jgi:hypothetical protein
MRSANRKQHEHRYHDTNCKQRQKAVPRRCCIVRRIAVHKARLLHTKMVLGVTQLAQSYHAASAELA